VQRGDGKPSPYEEGRPKGCPHIGLAALKHGWEGSGKAAVGVGLAYPVGSGGHVQRGDGKPSPYEKGRPKGGPHIGLAALKHGWEGGGKAAVGAGLALPCWIRRPCAAWGRQAVPLRKGATQGSPLLRPCSAGCGRLTATSG